MQSSPNPARSAALTIMFIMMVAFGLSVSLRLMGNTRLAGQICIGSGVLIVVVLVLGAVIVAANRNTGA